MELALAKREATKIATINCDERHAALNLSSPQPHRRQICRS
jgi:hypothetical protein